VVSYGTFLTGEFMEDRRYIIMLGAAAGAAIGMLKDRKHPFKGGILGAAAGVAAGSVAAGIYEYIVKEQVPFYSSTSLLYEEEDTI
jgi:hypothetical protein